MNFYKSCTLCPRKCQINRYIEKGFCGLNNQVKLALAKIFFYEEPPISGIRGSGTIFFSGCNLKCCFCQNSEISFSAKGQIVTIKRLSEIMLELEQKGAHNINLVTPTMYIPSIIKACKMAKIKGLTIPIIYNSSGYESVEAIKLLDGIIDVYLPDFKYFDNSYALKYSKVKDYLENVQKVLQEMVRQQPKCQFDKEGMIKKGVIVRHLLLPGLANDSKKILAYLYHNYQNNIYISIMNQYTPNNTIPYKEINKYISKHEYDEIINYAYNLGIRNAFCQLDGTAKKIFIPNFNYEGIKKRH